MISEIQNNKKLWVTGNSLNCFSDVREQFQIVLKGILITYEYINLQ